jgi:circadian clock protein KaiC
MVDPVLSKATTLETLKTDMPSSQNKRGHTVKKKTPKPAIGLVSSGIGGLDNILNGGFRQGTFSVIRGASGTGKTLFGLSFAAGRDSKATPGLFVSLEEPGYSLAEYRDLLGCEGAVEILDMRPNLEERQTAGNFELGGLLVRIENAVGKSGATRLVLDGIGVLFDTYDGTPQIRADINQLLKWASENAISVVGTIGEDTDYKEATGLLDYASHCLIRLQQKVDGGSMVRQLRVIKYRGRAHGTNEFPYVIRAGGISVMPVTDTEMTTKPSQRKISTGIKGIDSMLGGGLWAGSAAMVSGRSGTGKSLLSLSVVAESCKSGAKALYVSFEESPHQILRGAQSVGLNLGKYIKQGTLHIEARRAVQSGLEEHILALIDLNERYRSDLIVLDPISALSDIGDARSAKSMVLRLANYMKNRGVTVLMNELLPDSSNEFSNLNVSSLVDTWIRLRQVEHNGELNRMILIQKSRGASTSKQVHEFIISSKGLHIEAPYLGPGGMVFGTEKSAHEFEDLARIERIKGEIEHLEQRAAQQNALVAQENMVRESQAALDVSELMSKIDDLKMELDRLAGAREHTNSLRSMRGD